MRSALNIYYGDHEGVYPETPEAVLGSPMPVLWDPRITGPHPPTNKVELVKSRELRDTGNWAYVNDPKSEDYGLLFIDCTHTDDRGKSWSEY